jgi:dihydroorotate dehydrogenase
MGVNPPARQPAADGRGCVAAFGLVFPSPVGLAAGIDRSGERLAELERQGFGFVELGTVTPEPVAEHNPGVDALARVLSRYRARRRRGSSEPLIGVNLGRQPQHPLSDAGHDFAIGMRSAWRYADYLAINLTGPAARALLADDRAHELRALLERVHEQQEQLSAATGRRVPVLIKCPVRPGGSFDYMGSLRFDGVIAVFEDGPCDPPVLPTAQDVARLAHALAPSTALVVGSGVRSAGDAWRCLAAGARLVQVYRAYVEQGGELIERINRGLTAACGSLS